MPTGLFRFENFELDRGTYQLRRDGRAVHLERIPLDLLFLLAEKRNQLVTREEIVERIWGKGVFLDSANSINAAVRKIRRALGDDADAPRFIATVPVKGYRFIAPLRESAAAGAQVHSLRPSFVGREREMAQLREGFIRAGSGRGGILLLSGEPGIGKTRLTEELIELARARGHGVLIGSCTEQDQSVPFLPFVEILEGWVDRGRNPSDLRELLGEDASELARLLPKLARLFPGLAPPQELPPAQARRQLFNSFCDFTARLARESPTLLIFEDLHWGDDSTLALLGHLAHRLTALPLLVVGTYRDLEINLTPGLARFLEDLRRGHLVAGVPLKGLPSDAVAELLENLSGQPPPSTVVNEFCAETKGNPFFVEELFQHLAEEGRLYDAAGGFRSELKIAELDVPHGVRLVVGRRLARLNDATQRTLRTAAAIGRVFAFEVLAASGGADRLLESVEEAERAGLIYSRADSLTARFEFSHELIRQAVLSGISSARRAQLHLEVADAIERVYPELLDDHYSELAHHYRLGGNVAKAIDYLERAADQANQRSAPSEAATQFGTALGLIRELPATRDRYQRELALELALNLALGRSKGVGSDEAGESLVRARELCERLADQTPMLYVYQELWDSYMQRGEFGIAGEYAQRGLEVAENRRDPNMIASAQAILRVNSFWNGHFLEAYDRLNNAEVAGYTIRAPKESRELELLGAEYTIHALNDGFLGYLDRCRNALSEIVLHMRRDSDIHFAAFAWTHHAWGHLLAGEGSLARSSAEQAIALSREHGFEERAAIGKCIRGIALTDQGLLEDGIREIEEGLAALRVAFCGCFDSWFCTALALAQGKAGRPQEGLATVDRVLEVVKRRGGDNFYMAEAHRIRGELLLMQDTPKRAEGEEAIRAAINISRTQQSRLLELRATISLFRLLAGTSRRREARVLLAEIYNWFTEGFDTADLKEAKALLAELAV
ncbi:MAG: AAA family ATPase [Deltaproteobacteria bacterium]|nr:AAA family ATPase [Deltaproteobacteria bacterium]